MQQGNWVVAACSTGAAWTWLAHPICMLYAMSVVTRKDGSIQYLRGFTATQDLPLPFPSPYSTLP